MARDIYMNTITQVQTDGTLKALSGIQVYVYQPGTQTTTPIYSARTGASALANPIVTGATGAVEFYADVGEYDVRFVDTQTPARVADRTVQWNALSGANGGIPTIKLTRDGGLDLPALAADILRQLAQIGQVIEWWRPASSVAVPAGFEICDGRTIAANLHDFGTGQPITLPNLIGKFIIGANASLGDGAASSNGDAAGNAPGIGGVGGSNATKGFTVPAHWHDKGNLAIGNSGLHAHTTTIEYTAANVGSGGIGANLLHTAGVPVATGSETWGTTLTTHSHTNADFTGHVGNTGGVSGDAAMTTTAADVRPAHVGLLRLMKVKRS
jgi:hypothetical protein